MIGPNPENAWFHHWWHWWHSFVTLSMFRDVSRPMSFVEIFSSLSFSVDLIWSTEFGPDVSDSHPTLSNRYLLLFLTRSNLFFIIKFEKLYRNLCKFHLIDFRVWMFCSFSISFFGSLWYRSNAESFASIEISHHSLFG